MVRQLLRRRVSRGLVALDELAEEEARGSKGLVGGDEGLLEVRVHGAGRRQPLHQAVQRGSTCGSRRRLILDQRTLRQ